MAGTLTISQLSDGTNSTSSTNCIQGSAKAWVTFTGVSSGVVVGSYNVSSVTKNSTGDFTINFTNALPNANYAALATAISYGTADVRVVMDLKGSAYNGTPSLKTTTQCEMVYGSAAASALYDCGYASCAFLG